MKGLYICNTITQKNHQTSAPTSRQKQSNMKHIRTFTSDKAKAQVIADMLNAMPKKQVYGTSAYPLSEYFSFNRVPHNGTQHWETSALVSADASIYLYEGKYRVQYFEAFDEEAQEIENELRAALASA